MKKLEKKRFINRGERNSLYSRFKKSVGAPELQRFSDFFL